MSGQNQIQIIETTVATKEKAQFIAKTLLDKRVIACANISQIESVYNWGDKEQQEIEYQISCKTSTDMKDSCLNLIQTLHPYRTPMILSKQIDCNEEYVKWVKSKISMII